MKKKLRFIGNGMAGIRCLEEILNLAPEAFDVVVYGKEPHPNYNRILLSSVLAGDADIDQIVLNDWAWYREHGVELRAGHSVVEIDRENCRLRTDTGLEDEYDILVLATGSDPLMLPLPGDDKAGVLAFRNLKDCEDLLAAANQYRKAAVIGGGLLGLEAARGLVLRGMDVTVVHVMDSLMERQLDAEAARLLRKALTAQGMTFAMPKQTVAILGDERATGLEFADGEQLDADLVVMAVGIRPNAALARSAGLDVNRGIVVDDWLRTSDPHIYALGECAEHRGAVYGLVAPLFEQGQVLAQHLCAGETQAYEGSVVYTKLKVAGVDVFSAGSFLPSAEQEVVVVQDGLRGVYKKLVCDGDVVVGGVLFGNTADSGKLLQWMKEGRSIAECGVPLAEYQGSPSTVDDIATMDEAEIVCGCNGVTKGEIAWSVAQQGCRSVGEVRDCTGASRSCGGCKETVARIIASLTDGEAVREEALCACTDLTRDQVVAKIRELHLTHSAEVRNVLGWKSEGGCSKCRPAINYYLGMIWPARHADEPDSRHVNERLHANIQKDGTYSVVPRLYGGVVTSEQLRSIADAADKYDVPLMKITGGQRIDLLGVKKEDLPSVWSDLGLPSGYAYGKAIRTVKTCVGSDFCRFGTQDSIEMGIRLEKAFERINTPAKVKMAVSGCPRNCAESAIKDIGVVGVDGAWEIYVGGNGGIHLRGAELLVTVKTDDEVMEWSGAFLQLYREEATYGERTAHYVTRVGLAQVQARLADDAVRRALNARLAEAVAVLEDPWQQAQQNDAVRARYQEPIAVGRE